MSLQWHIYDKLDLSLGISGHDTISRCGDSLYCLTLTLHSITNTQRQAVLPLAKEDIAAI